MLWLSPAAWGQGIRMSPDFLPLEVGNTWRYRIVEPDGPVLGEFQMRIESRTILEGASYYLFDRFPLAPDGNLSEPVGIRYDPARRQYLHYNGVITGDLFPSLGAAARVLEADEAGLPRRAQFDYGDMAFTLERGIGIVEARYETPDGVRVAVLADARVGGEVRSGPGPGPAVATVSDAVTAPPAEPAGVIVATITEENPNLRIEAAPSGGGHRFILQVRNTGDQILAFDFNSSQSYDFVVLNTNGGEVWRWSRRMFFSQVMRSEGLRPGLNWTFEADWNHRDDALDSVPPGTYRVYGVLTAGTRLESDPIEFQVR